MPPMARPNCPPPLTHLWLEKNTKEVETGKKKWQDRRGGNFEVGQIVEMKGRRGQLQGGEGMKRQKEE